MKPKTCVVSLTYHEITEDPRVLKQARTLAANGYEISVFCDDPKDLPRNEMQDGVHINRFKCFDHSGGGTHFLTKLNFLCESLEQVQTRYVPFAEACDAMQELKNLAKGDKVVLDKSYYERHRGWKRIQRKLQHRLARLRIFSSGLLRPSLREAVTDSRKLGECSKNLFQTLSLLYAANIDRQIVPVRPDIIHAHDIYTLPAGVMLAQRHGAKLVYDAHEYEPGRATKLPEEGGQLATALENDCFPHVDAMVTVSESIADLYRERYQGPVVVVMNAPELVRYGSGRLQPRAANLSIRRQIGLTAQTPLIVFTGAVQREHRGADMILRALLYLPHYQFAVMGQRHTRNDAWFLSLAQSLGVREQVHLLPPVEARDVVQAIECCDVSVVPFQDIALNHQFAMPNKLFEAAFAGVPLCVSDLPEMRKFVETLGIGRAMDQTDPAKIAEAIRDVYENRTNYQATEASRETLLEEYSWAAQQEKLLSLYARLSSTHFISTSWTQSDRSEIVTSA